MNSAQRSTSPWQPTLALLLLLLLLAAVAGGTELAAQEIPPARFLQATMRGATPAPAPGPAMPLSLRARRPPFASVLVGTAIGGVLGAAVGGLGGAAIGSLEREQNGFISASEALGVIGVATLYPLGAAAGARLAATVDGARPKLWPLVAVSCVSAAAGGIIWNRVGEGLEAPETMMSWYLGAGVGVASHWIVTALAARRAPAFPTRPAPAPRDR